MSRTRQLFMHGFATLVSLVVVTSFSACKPRKSLEDSSGVASNVNFNDESIGLDRYLATSSDFAGMKQEFQAIAQVNGGKPRYEDAVFKLNSILNANFVAIPGQTLAEEEKVSILVWTVGDVNEPNPPYKRMNSALRSYGSSDDRSVDSMVKVLSSALNKLRGHTCHAVRGVSYLPPELLSKGAGQNFKDNGFTAYSEGNALATPFANSPIIIHVDSNACKGISQGSKYGQEKEILFPPGADFEVVSNGRSGNRTIIKLSHRGVNPGAAANGQPVLGGGNAGGNGGGEVGGGGGGGGGSLQPGDFVGKRFRNSAGRTLWFDAGGKCTTKTPGVVKVDCNWTFSPGKSLIAVTFGATAWNYKVISADDICWIDDSKPNADCSGPMEAYLP